MRDLLRRNKKRAYVQTYAEVLLKTREFDEAAVWIEELAALAPNSIASIGLQAEIAFQRKRYDVVSQLLQYWLDSPDDDESTHNSRLPLIADALQRFAKRSRIAGQTAAAETLAKQARETYREYVGLKPGQELLMAMFLADQGRLDEALDLTEIHGKDADPNQIAATCFTLLDGTAATPKQIRRVDKILQETIDTHKSSILPRVALAVVRDFQGRFAEAERIYRKVLEEDPGNPTVLNNLAVLFALQGIKLDEASALINLAIEKVGPTPGVLDSRAMVRLAQGRPTLALEDLQQAIAKKPSAGMYFHQALAYQKNGQKQLATEALEKAHSLGLEETRLQAAEQRAYRKLAIDLK